MIRRKFFAACAAVAAGAVGLVKARDCIPADKPLPGPLFRYYRRYSIDPPIIDMRFKITRIDLFNSDLKPLSRRNG